MSPLLTVPVVLIAAGAAAAVVGITVAADEVDERGSAGVETLTMEEKVVG